MKTILGTKGASFAEVPSIDKMDDLKAAAARMQETTLRYVHVLTSCDQTIRVYCRKVCGASISEALYLFQRVYRAQQRGVARQRNASSPYSWRLVVLSCQLLVRISLTQCLQYGVFGYLVERRVAELEARLRGVEAESQALKKEAAETENNQQVLRQEVATWKVNVNVPRSICTCGIAQGTQVSCHSIVRSVV